MIGLVTDSNAQLPPELAARYGVEVVPLTVTVDGVDYLEGVDLDADGFFARLESGGPLPAVSTSQPSPGRFARAFDALAARGADAILAVHIGSSVSGTVNAARLASADCEVPVRVVDTGTASFAVACCLWEAAEALVGGASLEEAVGVAERVAATIENVFIVGALGMARAGGRLREPTEPEGEAVPVLSLVEGSMRVVGQARDPAEAAEVMVERVCGSGRATGRSLKVGVGVADPESRPLWQALEKRLLDAPEVSELVLYRIGPSVAAHTGPGTTGAFYYPAS